MAGANESVLESGVEDLHSGDRMTQAEFHRIYERMPESFQAELIGGIVYVASPVKRPHGVYQVSLSAVFAGFAGATPGVEAGDNATIILGDEDEPQPDLYLRILPEYGGQSRDTVDEYIAKAPELVAEIAHSSRAIGLHDKRERYTRFNVLEYLVLCLRPLELRWFDLALGHELQPDSAGAYRSRVFPGLWVHGQGLRERDYAQLMSVLTAGLESPDHLSFRTRLATHRQSDPAS